MNLKTYFSIFFMRMILLRIGIPLFLFGLVGLACQPSPLKFESHHSIICLSDEDCEANFLCRDNICWQTCSLLSPCPKEFFCENSLCIPITLEKISYDAGEKIKENIEEHNKKSDEIENKSIYCGNGICEFQGKENCESCPQDCICPKGKVCRKNRCTSCGNGQCDSNQGENCTTCPKDCVCKDGKVCQNSRCTFCGNAKCDIQQGENCANCPHDCSCPNGGKCDRKMQKCFICDKNGQCDANQGENCRTCPQDCPCPKGQFCSANDSCQKCIPQCSSGLCGADGCGGQCPCSSDEICKQGICECKTNCRLNKHYCQSNREMVCARSQHSSCNVWKTYSCRFGCSQGRCKRQLKVLSFLLSCSDCQVRSSSSCHPILKLILLNQQKKSLSLSGCGKFIKLENSVFFFSFSMLSDVSFILYKTRSYQTKLAEWKHLNLQTKKGRWSLILGSINIKLKISF